MESIKQGKGLKNVLLVDVKGSDIGLLMRLATYASDIVEVLDDE